MPLEFCTTEELIEELRKRNTFLGVIVFSPQELLAAKWDNVRKFQVIVKNMTRKQAFSLLTDTAKSLVE
jgi:hypothetical protein